jgi:hypothetical protein
MADIKKPPVCIKFCLGLGETTTGIYETLTLASTEEMTRKIQICGFPTSKVE